MKWKLVGLALVLTVVGIGLFFSTSSSAMAKVSNFTADDVEINSVDGTVSKVTVAPSGTVEWKNLDEAPSNMTVDIYVSKSPDTKSNLVRVARKRIEISDQGCRGSWEFAFENIDLTNNSSLEWKDVHFKCEPDGKSKTISGIRVKVKVEIPSGGSVTAETDDPSFSVTTNNLESSAELGGNANTGGSP